MYHYIIAELRPSQSACRSACPYTFRLKTVCCVECPFGQFQIVFALPYLLFVIEIEEEGSLQLSSFH